jgi:hypothetical protein
MDRGSTCRPRWLVRLRFFHRNTERHVEPIPTAKCQADRPGTFHSDNPPALVHRLNEGGTHSPGQVVSPLTPVQAEPYVRPTCVLQGLYVDGKLTEKGFALRGYCRSIRRHQGALHQPVGDRHAEPASEVVVACSGEKQGPFFTYLAPVVVRRRASEASQALQCCRHFRTGKRVIAVTPALSPCYELGIHQCRQVLACCRSRHTGVLRQLRCGEPSPTE